MYSHLTKKWGYFREVCTKCTFGIKKGCLSSVGFGTHRVAGSPLSKFHAEAGVQSQPLLKPGGHSGGEDRLNRFWLSGCIRRHYYLPWLQGPESTPSAQTTVSRGKPIHELLEVLHPVMPNLRSPNSHVRETCLIPTQQQSFDTYIWVICG